MKVEIGVIAAAGSGTRMFPVAWAYPKELLPIIDRPAIHLIIEEFVDSGLKKVVVIVGENSQPLRRQYDLSEFPPYGRYEKLDEFRDKLKGIEVVFEQQVGPYGNGTPLLVARPHILDGERFIYAYGDDIIKSKVPFTRQLIERHNRTDALVAGAQEVSWKDVGLYGIAQIREGSEVGEMSDVVEKPSLEEARSNLAMFGRFLLSTEIIQILTEIPFGKANELWLTDAIREYISRGGRVVAQPVTDGRWLTIGDPIRYLETLMEYALTDPEIQAALEPRIRSLLGLN